MKNKMPQICAVKQPVFPSGSSYSNTTYCYMRPDSQSIHAVCHAESRYTSLFDYVIITGENKRLNCEIVALKQLFMGKVQCTETGH